MASGMIAFHPRDSFLVDTFQGYATQRIGARIQIFKDFICRQHKKTVVDRLKRLCLFLKPYDSEKFANTRVGEEFGIFKSFKIMVAAGKWWMFLSWSMTGTEKTHATR